MRSVKKWLCIILATALAIGSLGCSIVEDTQKPDDLQQSPQPTAEPVLDLSVDGTKTGFDYSEGLTDEGFFEGVTASKYVTLPAYKGIEVPKDVTQVSEEDIQLQIDALLEEYATYEPVYDRAVEDGDTVNMDYVGTIDGVEFDGGNTGGMGTQATIGVDQYIDDFLEQLIGRMPGENFDIEVTFPDDYHAADLQGKDAVFNITLHSIQGEKSVPELSDDIAVDYGFDDVDALREDISAWLLSQKKLIFFDELIAQAECTEIPDAVLEYCLQSEMAYYQSYADAYGMDLETVLLSNTGCASAEEYEETYADLLKQTATYYLAIQAIAENEGLEATIDDVAQSEFAGFEETYGMPYLRMYLLQERIVPDFVIENGKTA